MLATVTASWVIIIYHLLAQVGVDSGAGAFPTKEACQVALSQKQYSFGYRGECKLVTQQQLNKLHKARMK